MDMRDMYNGVTIPGTFANLSIMNYNNKKTYHATYMKLQNLFADVGGITRAISILAVIANYLFSESSYKEKIIHYIFENEKDDRSSTGGKYLKCNSKPTVLRTFFKHKINIPNSKLHNTKVFANNKLKQEMLGNNSLYSLLGISGQNLNRVRTKQLTFNTSLDSRESLNTIYEKKIKKKINLFKKLLAILMFDKKLQRIYYLNHDEINKILDIRYYLKLKRKVTEIDMCMKRDKLIDKISLIPSIFKKSVISEGTFPLGLNNDKEQLKNTETNELVQIMPHYKKSCKSHK